MVDVADRADIDVRLGALELLLGHLFALLPISPERHLTRHLPHVPVLALGSLNL
jgi:hypothetical protein